VNRWLIARGTGREVVHQHHRSNWAAGRLLTDYGVGALDDSFVRQATTTSQMIHPKITT
jgi:hypothetical protein